MVILNHLHTITVPTVNSYKAHLGAHLRLVALAWSPNNKKLAVAGKDRVIYLYDELGVYQDKFPTRPVQPKHGSFSYSVSGISFSPDSTKLAIAQTDATIFIYKIGDGFKLKKSICNKFTQPESVVSIIWPNEFEIICGLVDGKLRHTPILPGKHSRSKTFYNPESTNISLTSTREGIEMASGHVDGRIAVFTCGDSTPPTILFIIRHTCPPFALAFAGTTLFVGGNDKKIILYNLNGKILQTFDYKRIGDKNDRDFITACGSPTGLSIVFGSYNRLRVLRYSLKKRIWEDSQVYDVINMYAVTALKWKYDGTRLAVGTLTGGLHIYETILKKTKTTEYEIAYVTHFHAIITIKEPFLQAEINSECEYEIFEVKMMANNRFAIGITPETIIICDIENNYSSEIGWKEDDGNEKYYFDNPHVCMLFHHGFLHLIEYGINDILGIYRTEIANPHVISVRINERIPKRLTTQQIENKKLAYLLDRHTIAIVDLVTKIKLGVVNNDCTIDWLELNETGTKLLYRDRKLGLYFVDVSTMSTYQILTTCSYVQWVAGSDVVIAQCNKMIHIWYNVTAQETSVEIETKGLAYNVITENYVTNILVREGSTIRMIPLDSARIQFVTAVDDGDLLRGLLYLETFEENSTTQEIQLMWKTLSIAAIECGELVIAQRACCGYGNYARAACLQQAITITKMAQEDGVSESIIINEVLARLAMILGNLKDAEHIFIENGDIESAVQMHQDLNKWDEALRVACKVGGELILNFTRIYLKKLSGPGYEQQIAEFLRENKNYKESVTIFMENGFPGQAAMIIQQNFPEMKISIDTVKCIGEILCSFEFFQEAGEMYESAGDQLLALKCFINANSFNRAVQLARIYYPQQVVELEEAWGEYDFSLKKMDQACHHFLEAGKLRKALTASLGSRQWEKAIHIIESIDDDSSLTEECAMVGDHLQKKGDIFTAETFYTKAGQLKKSIKMYLKLDKFDEAFRIASTSPVTKKDLCTKFLKKAETHVKDGQLFLAEQLFIIVGETDSAIDMYAAMKKYDEMLRLVEKYHPSHLERSRLHIAQLMKINNDLKGAETYFLKAGDSISAVQMYKEKKLWEDAFRVSRNHMSNHDWRKVVFEWANELGGELAVKLLNKAGCLVECVEFCCQVENWDFAFELAKHSSKETQLKAYNIYGKYLEDNSKFMEASTCYINGKTPEVAINMFIRQEMYQEAIEITEDHLKEELPRVLILYAKILFEQDLYEKFEIAIVRAKRIRMGIQMYKDKNMWNEALKFCKEYKPKYYDELQFEYDSITSNNNTIVHDIHSLIQQAIKYENMEEYKKCIDCYLKLSTIDGEIIIGNENLLSDCWIKAGDLAIEHLNKDLYIIILESLCPMLMSIGNFAQAAIFYIKIGKNKEGINALLDGDLWKAAKRAAKKMGSKWEEFVNQRHIEILQNDGNVDELANVNLEAALDLLAQQDEWDICIEKSKRDISLYNIYLAKYITNLLGLNKTIEALKVYTKYGCPTEELHFSLYKTLAFNVSLDVKLDTFEVWSQLRDIFHVQATSYQLIDDENDMYHHMFEKYFFMAHLYTNRAAIREVPNMEVIVAKITISLLRYTDIIPTERVYFEAGICSKELGWNNMAFVLLNHFLDIRDAIEDGHKNTEIAKIDYSDFIGTEIPTKCFLTNNFLISDAEYEDVKEWVLSSSMDKNINQELPKDKRGEFEGTLMSDDIPNMCRPCIITGYPSWGTEKASFAHGLVANREDWNKFILIVQNGNYSKVKEVYEFINCWCGANMEYML